MSATRSRLRQGPKARRFAGSERWASRRFCNKSVSARLFGIRQCFVSLEASPRRTASQHNCSATGCM